MPSGVPLLKFQTQLVFLGLALNLAPLNEQKKFAMFFLANSNCKVGPLYSYTWSYVITPRNGSKENDIKLFHPYKWHSLLTTGFWGPACRHLHKTFQQRCDIPSSQESICLTKIMNLRKSCLCPKISIILR